MEKKKFIVLVIVLCMVFSLFSTSAFAQAPEDNYVDADTACKLYSELYAKYYPNGEVTVTVNEADYKPILESTLKKKLIDLEENLKIATLPENNVWVKYDENNNIMGIAYKQGYEEYAKEYIELQKEQELKASDKAMNNVSQFDKGMDNVTPMVIGDKETKNVGRAFYWNISNDLPWHPKPNCAIGFACTFQVAKSKVNPAAIWFPKKPWGFGARRVYSGLGDCEVSLRSYSSTRSNADTKCSMNADLEFHAWVTDADGLLHTYRDNYQLGCSVYSSQLW